MVKAVDETMPSYICGNGRKLIHERSEVRKSGGFKKNFEVYACSDCSGCTLKSKSLDKYDEEKDANKNKVMKINEVWEDLKMDSHKYIQSEKRHLKQTNINSNRRSLWRYKRK